MLYSKMKKLDEMIIESDQCQFIMQEYLAGICYEINKMKAISPNIETDDLVSKMTSFITYCDKVLMENEENKEKLDLSLKETAILETRLDLEKRQRQEDLSRSFIVQEVEHEEKSALLKKIKDAEGKLSTSTQRFNSIMHERNMLIQAQTKLKLLIDSLEEKVKYKDATIANLNLKLQAVTNDFVTVQKTETWRQDKWADDSVLSSYFSAMTDTINSDNILFLCPSVTTIIKLGSPEMVVECLEKTSFHKCKYIFLCINDSESTDKGDSGSHWSLLFIEKLRNIAYHFDSLSPLNSLSAQIVAGNLGIEKSKVIQMDCIQQSQSFECGIHVLANAKYIAYHYCKNNETEWPFKEWFNGIRTLNNQQGPKNTIRISQVTNQGSSQGWSVCKTNKTPNKWQCIPKKKGKSKSKPIAGVRTTRNRFEILDAMNDNDDCENMYNSANVPPCPTPKTDNNYKKNYLKNSNRTLTRQTLNNRVIIGSDSQGRGLSTHLVQTNNVNSNVFNVCKPGAPLEVIINSIASSDDFKELSQNDCVILIGGTNNINKKALGNTKRFLCTLSDYLHKQQKLFEGTNLVLSTIPYRYDLHSDSPENLLIKEVNTIIRKLTYNHSHVRLLDLYLLQRCHHTTHGLHINKRGKIFICKEIIKITEVINNLNSKLLTANVNCTPLLGLDKEVVRYKPTHEMFNSQLSSPRSSEPIKVIEHDMSEYITKFQNTPTIAFAHCISADIEDRRHMSRGVAVSFRRAFGRPKRSDLVSGAIAFQQHGRGAAVYSLVTKPTYNSKPTHENYNQAFHELIASFKVNKFEKLICSPMGCMRDRISPQLFSENIVKFYRTTGARVDIIVWNERATRTLRNGLEHEDFVTLLRDCIAQELLSRDSPATNQADPRPILERDIVPTTDPESFFSDLSVCGFEKQDGVSVELPINSFCGSTKQTGFSNCTRGSTLNSLRIEVQKET